MLTTLLCLLALVLLLGVTTPTSMVNRLTGTETWTDPVNFAAGTTVGGNVVGGASTIITVTASTLTVTQALHAGAIINLKRAAGIAVTLPNATGTGARYQFFIGALITSNTTVIARGTALDVMSGIFNISETAGPLNIGFLSAANTNTITMNGSTQGGLLGDSVYLTDIALNQWLVVGEAAGTGSLITPFSNT
jgi:hypothetical protein